MTTKELKIFLNIAEYQNVTKTAEDFHMTQPAVSSLLKRMEAEMGTQLFVRRGKWLELNEQGWILYNNARDIESNFTHFSSAMRNHLNVKLEIVIEVRQKSDYFLQLTDTFTESHPDVTLTFRSPNCLSRKEIQKKGKWMTSDFTLDYRRHNPGISSLPVDIEIILYALLPSGHPLCTKASLTFKDLQNENFVFSRKSSDNELEDSYRACLHAGLLPKIAVITDSLNSKLAAIQNGCGIGFLYNNESQAAGQFRAVKMLPVNRKASQRVVCLNYDPERLSAQAKELLAFIKDPEASHEH